MIDNPTIAPSNNYGNYTGGTYGCTRKDVDQICENVDGKKMHGGIDIACPLLTEISAILKGEIIFKDENGLSDWGKYAVIKSISDNDLEIFYLYAHLDEIYDLTSVKKGEKFAKT